MTATTTEQTLRELLTVMWLDGHIELTDGPDDIADVVTVGEAAINASLDEKPDNWRLRELYADWLEALGNPRCESQRWMVDQRVEPDYRKATYGDMSWNWVEFCIRRNLFELLLNSSLEGANYKEYLTRTIAELDLHNALVKAGEITCEEVEA